MITKREVLLRLFKKTLTDEHVDEYSQLRIFEHDYLCRPNILIEPVFEDSVFVIGLSTMVTNRKKKLI